MKIFEKINNQEDIPIIYNDIGFVHQQQGNVSSALEFYEKSVRLSKLTDNKSSLALTYQNISVIMASQGNFSKASEYIYKALKIFESINDEKGIAISYHSFGLSLIEQNEIDKALKYFLDALKLYQKVRYIPGETAAYIEIGAIYQKKKKYDTAFEYYDKSLKTQPTKYGLANSYFKIGTVYQSKNEIKPALIHYYKSLKLREKIDNKEGQSLVLSKIGLLEIKNGKIDIADQQIHKALALAKELNYPVLIKEAAEAKASLAIAKGDYRLAYEMEKLRNEMKDKIQNENNQKDFIKQQFKYEHDKELIKKDLDIEFEKKNAELIQMQSDVLTLKNKELASKNKIINEQVTEMNLLIQKLQESNESLNQFAAVAAHDLKAPLRNIQGFSQILHRKYADKFPQKDMELFEFITGSCLSLKDLIDGLLNYSKISNMKYEAQCVDLAEIVSHVKSNLTNIIKETRVTLHVSDDLPKVFGQGSLLFQVFLNFINNAIKFRRIEEGLQSAIWINSEHHDDNHIKISIKDNGIGIEEKHQKEIFGIFKKLHSSDKYEGSGIGLSVCKKIIERFGGEVWLESEKGVGTTFFFSLKLYNDAFEKGIKPSFSNLLVE